VVLVHHWDTDGIASATLLSKFIECNKLFIIPKIGFYSSEAVSVGKIEKFYPDLTVLLDYGISMWEVAKLASTLNHEVLVVDHHLNTLLTNYAICNPAAYGYSTVDYPSTTWVIKEHLGFEDEVKIVLGVIGDAGTRIKSVSVRTYVLNFLEKEKLTLQDVKKAVELLDSCYKLVDYNCIGYARSLVENSGIREILEDKLLQNSVKKVKDEIWKAIENSQIIEIKGPIKVFSTTSEAYITSSIGRFLAVKNPEDIIVLVNAVAKLGIVNIYVRSVKYKVGKVIGALKNLGINVGGKDHVFSLVCEGKCYEKLKTIISILEKQLGVLK